jgi:hypothetical protein
MSILLLCLGTAVASTEYQIGKLSLGLSQAEVYAILDCPVKRGEDQMWDADGLYHQEWEYSECGVILDMSSKKHNGVKKIESITITAPSKLTTTKGIGIGSSREKVIAAYRAAWNKKQSREDYFVAGSVYGGLMFGFQDGKVINIFLGAAAE